MNIIIIKIILFSAFFFLGELIGFGYTGLNSPEARQLQKLQLDITRFNPNGLFNVEARSDTEEHIACHGDSGSPFIVYHTVENPSNKISITVPFVVGNLARIFGARDLSPSKLTCPIPHETGNHPLNSTLNTVTESFCNTASMIDWISITTGISVKDLTDPFYSPPHPPCINCKKKTNTKGNNSSKDQDTNSDDDDDEEDGDEDDNEPDKSANKKGQHQWNIGVAADENGLLDTTGNTDRIWIGGMGSSFLLKAEANESKSLSSFHQINPIFVLYALLVFVILNI